MLTLAQLKRRAQKHGLIIRKTGDGYTIVDQENDAAVAYLVELSLDEIEAWIDDYEKLFGDD